VSNRAKSIRLLSRPYLAGPATAPFKTGARTASVHQLRAMSKVSTT
jgi:hypothetical protein